MVEFFSAGCGWCHSLEKDVHSDPLFVNKVNQSFLPVQLHGIPATMQEQYGVAGTPHTLFLAPDGSAVFRVRGYTGPGNFLNLLNQAERRYRFFQSNPGAWPRMAEADEHWVHKRFEESTAIYRALLEENPKNVGALLRLGDHEWRRGDPDLAEPLFKRAHHLVPKEAYPRFVLATRHFNRGEMAKAVRAYRELVRYRGWCGDSAAQRIWVIARLKGDQRYLEQAQVYLKQRLEIRRKRDAWQSRFLIMWLNDNISTKSMEEQVAKSSRSWFKAYFHFYRGVDRIASGDTEGARADLKHAIELEPHVDTAGSARMLLDRIGS